MRLLLDTNVVLDLILSRQPFLQDAQPLWHALTGNQPMGTGYVSATTITDIYYVARKAEGREKAYQAVQLVLDSVQLCDIDKEVLEMAMQWQDADFEDNVQIACALNENLDGIVTRDKAGFKHSSIPIFTPAEALAALAPSTN
jgi:predicted nucleic acid-binding protein